MVNGKIKAKNLFSGKVIGAFTLVKKIGEGGQAQVWEAVYENKHIAIKIGSDSSHLYYEAALRNVLEYHENLFDIIVKEMCIDNYKIFAMELMKESLKDYVKNNKIDDIFIKKLGFSLIDVSKHIKNKGYVFRDINPSNIMINQNNIIKLIDIGVMSKINSPVKFEGTAKFSSYNSLNSKPPSPWDDLYSILLVLLYIERGGVMWECEINTNKKGLLKYAEDMKILLPLLLENHTNLSKFYYYLQGYDNREILDSDYDNLKNILEADFYNLENIYNYTSENLDNFLQKFTTKIYSTLTQKRYMTIHHLLSNNRFNLREEKLIYANQANFLTLLEQSATAMELLVKL